MKAALLYGIRDIRIEEKEIPKIKEGEVLVKIRYALTCGTDLKAYERGHPYIKYPIILGHEYVGEVVEVGKEVEGLERGDLITSANSAPCYDCFYCKKNLYNLCERLKENLIGFTINGSFAEYMVVPERILRVNTYKIKETNFRKYASLEPLACVVHSWNLIKVGENDEVLIIGSGPIAILHAQIALNHSKKVTLIGKHESRLKIARKLGIEVLDLEQIRTKENEYDVVIEAVGSIEAWNMAFDFVRKGGTVLFFGGLSAGSKVCFDAYKIHYGEVKLLGSFHHEPNSVKKAFEMIEKNMVNTELIITSERKLEEIGKAFEDMANGKDMKVGILP